MAAESKPRRRLPASPFVSPAKPIGSLVAGTLGDILSRRGFADAEILANWQAIAGTDLARISRPEKLAWPRREAVNDDPDAGAPPGATLHLRVEGPAAIEIQHMSGQILERVNRYFGFAAVTRLRIIQAPVSERGSPAPPSSADDGAPAASSGRPDHARDLVVEGIEDEDLAAALIRLGRAIRRS